MILTAFGAAWLAAWCWFARHGQVAPMLLVAALGGALFVIALRIYRRSVAAAPAQPETPAQRRAHRWFHIINAGQWVAIFIVLTLLNNTGRSRWDVPVAIAIIGLHFLALAQVFHRNSHYVTGAVMLLLAGSYPFVAADGPESTLGLAGTGLILWVSALWALRPDRRDAAVSLAS